MLRELANTETDAVLVFGREVSLDSLNTTRCKGGSGRQNIHVFTGYVHGCSTNRKSLPEFQHVIMN